MGQSTVVVDEENTYHRMDVLWHYLSSMRAADSSFRFPRLTKVAKLVLTIPHSNAQEERLFSIVCKNKTAFRPSLDPKGTLSSILAIKLAAREPAHCFEPSKEVLSKAKAATWEYNKAHSILEHNLYHRHVVSHLEMVISHLQLGSLTFRYFSP